MVDEKHHGRPDCVHGLRTDGGSWHYMASYLPLLCGDFTASAKYLRHMNDASDLVALNLAWLGWEVARWQDVVDWGISAAGALTLLAINVMRLRRAWRQRNSVDNAD